MEIAKLPASDTNPFFNFPRKESPVEDARRSESSNEFQKRASFAVNGYHRISLSPFSDDNCFSTTTPKSSSSPKSRRAFRSCSRSDNKIIRKIRKRREFNQVLDKLRSMVGMDRSFSQLQVLEVLFFASFCLNFANYLCEGYYQYLGYFFDSC